MIQNVQQAEEYFSQFIGTAVRTTGKNITVDRIWPLLEKAGNPQNKLQAIHLAGTSGKTSTAYFIASLLKQSGKKVGLTVSPHISSITERLQIDGDPVNEQNFCSLLNKFIGIMGTDIDASYFELLIVFVFWAFVQLEVDYAVVETGLGGLYDGTNVFRQPEKICVITDIGIDHQNVLGNTIAEITLQKSGIIQPNNHVFINLQTDEIMQIIKDKVKAVDGHLQVENFHEIAGNLPEFQKRNWQLAKSVFEYIQKRDNLNALDEKQLENSQISVIGRMQKLKVGNQVFILDGAHNVQKMTAFVDSFIKMYPNIKVPVLLAMKKDKEYKKVIKIIAPITNKVFCIGFSSKQDMPIESVNPELLVDACKKAGISSVEKCNSIKEVLALMKNLNEPLNIVTGSFYILGNVINELGLIDSK